MLINKKIISIAIFWDLFLFIFACYMSVKTITLADNLDKERKMSVNLTTELISCKETYCQEAKTQEQFNKEMKNEK